MNTTTKRHWPTARIIGQWVALIALFLACAEESWGSVVFLVVIYLVWTIEDAAEKIASGKTRAVPNAQLEDLVLPWQTVVQMTGDAPMGARAVLQEHIEDLARPGECSCGWERWDGSMKECRASYRNHLAAYLKEDASKGGAR